MTTEIKTYEGWVVVETYDDKIHLVRQSNFPAFQKDLMTNKVVKFGEFELEKTSNIRRTYPRKGDDTIEFLIGLPSQCKILAKRILRDREKEGKRVNRKILQNILRRKLKDEDSPVVAEEDYQERLTEFYEACNLYG